MVFSTIGGFRISLFTKNTLSKHPLGRFLFTSSSLEAVAGDSTSQAPVPLLFQQQVNEVEESTLLFSTGKSLEHTEKVILATSADESTGLYEITFSLRCCPLESSSAQMNQLWDLKSGGIKKADMADRFMRPLKMPNQASESLTNSSFRNTSWDNQVEFLVDGKDTFRRYYECLYAAKHSISILAWELCLGFGLVERKDLPEGHKAPPAREDRPTHDLSGGSRWVSLEDVLLARARDGVKIRIVVWRHSMMTVINRIRYMGPVEQQVSDFCERARRMGLPSRVFRNTQRMPGAQSIYAHPSTWDQAEPIVIIIVGNPRGLISCHHEKLLLIDSECPLHTVALTGVLLFYSNDN